LLTLFVEKLDKLGDQVDNKNSHSNGEESHDSRGHAMMPFANLMNRTPSLEISRWWGWRLRDGDHHGLLLPSFNSFFTEISKNFSYS
jgi:hypothetical protein